MIFKTIIGNVKLTKARIEHILQKHPVMKDHLCNIKEVLEAPKEIRFSSRSDEVLLFYSFFDNIESGKYLAVVVNKSEKSVLTTYLTNRIKTGRKYEKE